MLELLKKSRFLNTHLLILVLLLIIFFPTLFLGKTLFYRDLSIQDYPLTNFVVSSLKNGDFPLRNPFLFSSFPQMASIQPPVFYPPFILFLLLPFHLALSISLIIHYFLAGFGVYLIGKYWKLNTSNALLGGIIFALNGYMFELNNLESTVYAVTWVPYIFLYIEKFLDKTSLKYFLLIVLFNSLQLATGRLDYFYFTQMFLWPWFIYKFIIKEKNYKNEIFTKNIIFIIFSFIISLMLLSVQIIPSLEYVKNTFRGNVLSYAGATFWSLHPFQLLQIVFNNFFGDLYNSSGIYVLLTDKKNLNFLIYNLYIGTPCLYIIIYAFFKKDNKVNILGIMALFFALISLGKYTPFFSLLFNYLPGFNILRYPIKLFIFTIFSLSLITMIGLEKLCNSNDFKKFFSFVFAGFLISSACVLFIYLYTNDLVKYFNINLNQFGLSIINIDFMKKSLIFSTVVLFIFLLLIIYLQREKLTKPAFVFLITLLVGYELVNNNISNLWVADSKLLYEKPQIAQDLDYLINKDLYYLIHDTEAINPITDLNKPKVLRDIQANLSTIGYNLSLIGGFKNAFGYSPSPPTKIFKLVTYINDEMPEIKVTDEKKARIMKMMGIRYYIWHMLNFRTVPPNRKFFNLIKEYQDLGLQLWELKDYQPIFTFKSHTYLAKSEMEILKILLGIKKPELDIDNKVFILDEGNKIDFPPLNNNSSPGGEKVKLLKESNNRLTIEAESQNPGFLILAINYDKDWKAYDNGKEVTILKANYYQQAINLNKGKHLIEMVYRPESFVIGGVISLITLFILIGLSLFLVNQKKIRHE